MPRLHRHLALLASLWLVIAVSGCRCIDNQCTSVGVGNCTGYPGSAGLVGDVCGGGCGGCGGGPCGILGPPSGGGWYSGGGSCGMDGGCGGCGGCGVSGWGWAPGHGPVMGVLRLVRQALVCGFGCGQVYWCDWISDPPACQDPCSFSYGDGGCGSCTMGGCGGGCGEAVIESGCTSGCCGGGCASNGPTRSYNWSHGSGCSSGTCAAHNAHQSRSHGIAKTGDRRTYASRSPSGSAANLASMPGNFRPSDRVVHMTTQR